MIKDFNNNGVIDDGDVLSGRFVSANSSNSIGREIEAGTYFVRVFPNSSSGNTSYGLTFNFSLKPNNVIDNPDDTILTILGELGTEQRNFRDFVGVTDRNDYYRFTLPDNGEIDISLGSVTQDAFFQLIKDFNNNGVTNDGDILSGRFVSANSSNSISRTIETGTYLVRVFPNSSSGNTNYELGFLFESVPSTTIADPGNQLDAALDIGELGTGSRLFTDYVGVTDRNDYYSFTVDTNTEVNIALRDVTEDAFFQLIDDFNNNGVIDDGDILSGRFVSANSSNSISREIESGTYFVRVFPNSSSGNTNYELRIAT
ncbi:MAG: hypothetical protein F6K54_26645 [Okeania sp. SIO3B5]|uniref:pre-peptidase C-terminal domain-containing protein n=1 Tax=Okeania sp. SIO3B5 TaxID=2607811 RepID=UPI0014005BCB|nr:pre-peptidase C-terminal domain-containing protein [Okeania sp. SIO3B5]NEO56347.1 hypothetical protein [Okeania sp. SIO3B5]